MHTWLVLICTWLWAHLTTNLYLIRHTDDTCRHHWHRKYFRRKEAWLRTTFEFHIMDSVVWRYFRRPVPHKLHMFRNAMLKLTLCNICAACTAAWIHLKGLHFSCSWEGLGWSWSGVCASQAAVRWEECTGDQVQLHDPHLCSHGLRWDWRAQTLTS